MALCYQCNGEGFIVTCMDDICRGGGECIHGDGEEICPVCEGEGTIGPEDEYDPMSEGSF